MTKVPPFSQLKVTC